MITDVNPFVYSRPIAPDEVIDREDETQRLLRWAVGGHYVRLYAPRKYGKTSLLGRVLRDGERSEGLIPITVDLYGVLSIADLTVRIERAYARQLKGKVRARIEEFLQSTGLGLSLGAFGVSAQLQIDPKIDPLPALHALLDLPLRLEEGGGYRALIVFDEFQDIVKVRDADAILRSHIQYQGDVASYIFSGSEPGMMEQIFESRDRPLYGSAVPMRLERLEHGDIAAYVIDRFRGTNRSVGDALNPLLQTARRPSPAGDPARAPALGGGRGGRHGDAAGLAYGARGGAERAAARVRRALAAASAPRSRRRSGRSSAAAAHRSAPGCSRRSSSTRRPRTRRCAGSPRRATSRRPTAPTGSSTRSSPSGSVGCATTPRN